MGFVLEYFNEIKRKKWNQLTAILQKLDFCQNNVVQRRLFASPTIGAWFGSPPPGLAILWVRMPRPLAPGWR
jgi:hypothetical protein